MAESMLMSREAIAEADASLDPGRSADKPAPRAKDKEPDPEPEIEYVGPEDDGDDGDARAEADAKDKPEAKTAEKPGDKAKKSDDKPKFVPHEALHEERRYRQRIEEKAAADRKALEEKLQFLAGQIAQVNQERQQPAVKEDEPAPLRWEDDPGGFTQRNFEELRKELNGLKSSTSERQQQEQQQTQYQQAVQYYTNAITASEEQIAQEQPDYYPAVAALRNARAAELSVMPQYRGNPQAVQARLNQEALELAEHAVKSGEAPASVYYRLAVARGWRPEMAQQQAPAQQQEAAKPPVKNAEAAAEIEQLSRAKEASEGLGNSGGSAPNANRMSLETFERMSNKEIEAWVRRENKKGPGAVDAALEKMMGVRR